VLNQHERAHIGKYRKCDDHGRGTVDIVLDREYERSSAGKAPSVKEDDKQYSVVSLPVVFMTAAAGFGNYWNDNYYEMADFPADAVPAKAAFGVKISGDSMEPDIHDGDTVFVDGNPVIEEGEVGIFLINGESFCKELRHDGDKKTRLVSRNHKYKDIILSEGDTVCTIGKVLL
jgi:SOS-response transcriptional repressor LexA